MGFAAMLVAFFFFFFFPVSPIWVDMDDGGYRTELCGRKWLMV